MHLALAALGVWCLLGIVATAAQAGGTRVSVAATAGRVWVTTASSDVAEIDASSGRVLRRVRTRYPFPLDVGVSDGNVWVSSVENGFVSGAVTRIPFEAWRAVDVPLVMTSRPVLGLAVGSGVTWALAGPWKRLSLVFIDQVTRRTSLVPVRHDLGWIAADNTGETSGLFGVAGDEVVLVRRDGRSRILARIRPVAPPVVAEGQRVGRLGDRLYRLNASTGAEQGSVAVRMAGAEIAVGGGFVGLLRLRPSSGATSYELLKIDAHGMRVVGRRPINAHAGGIAFGDGAVWVGVADRANNTSVTRVSRSTLRSRTIAIGP